MRDNTRAGIVLIDGWLGAENREPAGWLMMREKAYTIQRSAKIAARPPGSNIFGVRSQALRLFLPHMHPPSFDSPLIPRQFAVQLASRKSRVASHTGPSSASSLSS